MTTVLAPLLGVRLAEERWELGSGLALVRGDLLRGAAGGGLGAGPRRRPAQHARLPDRRGRAAGPAAADGRAARLPEAADDAATVQARRRRRSGRRPGGASTRAPGSRFRSASPGTRAPGEYWLEGPERDELVELFELVRMRPLRAGRCRWALTRFEMGCGQPLALEGLSDHLLALRALLDGDEHGPAGVPARLAALCAEPADRRRAASRRSSRPSRSSGG